MLPLLCSCCVVHCVLPLSYRTGRALTASCPHCLVTMESGGGTHRQTRLNAFEDSTLQTGVNPSSTITWFNTNQYLFNTACSGALDVATAASWAIEERLRAVLVANPWLAGKIVKDDGNYCLRYKDTPSTKDEIHRMFRYIPSSSLFTRRTPYFELGSVLAKEGPALGAALRRSKTALTDIGGWG